MSESPRTRLEHKCKSSTEKEKQYEMLKNKDFSNESSLEASGKLAGKPWAHDQHDNSERGQTSTITRTHRKMTVIFCYVVTTSFSLNSQFLRKKNS